MHSVSSLRRCTSHPHQQFSRFPRPLNHLLVHSPTLHLIPLSTSHHPRRMSTSPPTSSPPSSPAIPLPSLSAFSGYFKRSIPERQRLLLPYLPSPPYTPTSLPNLLTSSLPLTSADHMVENCIGLLSLPLAIAPSFIINGAPYLIPMAVEEPSVVAAASAAGKLIAEGGGFTTSSTGDVMIGQIQLLIDFPSITPALTLISTATSSLIRQANAFCPSMVKRGGGVTAITAEARPSRSGKSPSIVVFIKVDVCDSMGANAINTICEGLSPHIAVLLHSLHPRVGLRILSNLCVDRRTTASFRLPFSALGYRGVEGGEVARRVVEAYEFACDDEFRAVTNNKGVMNGMDAVAIACGQDWRAIEAAAHGWAALRKRFGGEGVDTPYGPLASYAIEGGEGGKAG